MGDTVTLRSIISQLANIAGEEQAREVVQRAARAAGASLDSSDPQVVDGVLATISVTPGILGTTARVLRRRARAGLLPAPTPHRAPSLKAPAAGSPELQKLVGMLAGPLGEERAAEVVASASERLSLDPSAMSSSDCLAVLDDLTRAGGLVGTVARFVKVRTLLDPA
ncbi:MAG: hypothetical protein IT377_16875 [Polyangiaceae bacterium]|nr:hypothetical protein [Polyangiaceae bacterium]